MVGVLAVTGEAVGVGTVLCAGASIVARLHVAGIGAVHIQVHSGDQFVQWRVKINVLITSRVGVSPRASSSVVNVPERV